MELRIGLKLLSYTTPVRTLFKNDWQEVGLEIFQDTKYYDGIALGLG